jgi:protein-S-isoprenylcysteine O-methyltransferase Ste14
MPLAIADMDKLTKTALIGALKFQLLLGVLIFGPVLSVTYWQGWLYWGEFFICMLATTLYFLQRNPALVERRMRAGPTAEQRPRQKLIQLLASISLFATIVISALDHRFGWSVIPSSVVIFGDFLFVLGFVMVFFVMRENSFAAATIRVEANQPVVSTGPYAIVRHPMYAGAFPIFFATPIALGSWWGLLPACLVGGAIVWRLLDEELYLDCNLPGYQDYRQKVRWRLLPWVW